MPKGKDWLWIIVGVVFALFVLPAVQGVFASRKKA